MHVIGFYHEHNRYDRNDYIEILTENMKEEFFKQFEIINETKNMLFTPYDYYSITHYGSNAFSNNGRETIRAREPSIILTNPNSNTPFKLLNKLKIIPKDDNNYPISTWKGHELISSTVSIDPNTYWIEGGEVFKVSPSFI